MSVEGITISQMPTEATIDGTELLPTLQGGVNKNISIPQLLAYLEGQFTAMYAPLNTNPLLATLEAVYPVGSLYVNAIANTNPNTLFGFGTWAAITDRMMIGAGNLYAVASTGGEPTHTLTSGEMPAHTHPLTDVLYWPVDSGHPSVVEQAQSGGPDGPNSGYQTVTGSTGGGAAHNNMPPYQAVYMWKRTA